MSLFQIARRPGRIRIAVDTLTVGFDSTSKMHASKFFVLPHAHAVIAFRGLQVLWANVLAYLSAWPINHANDVIDNLGELVAAVSEQFGKNPEAQKMKEAGLPFTCEILVAGARSDGSLVCYAAEVDLVQASVGGRELLGDASAPAVTAEYSDDASHRRAARLQLAKMREICPEQVTGGRLLMAEITTREIKFRDLGEIELQT